MAWYLALLVATATGAGDAPRAIGLDVGGYTAGHTGAATSVVVSTLSFEQPLAEQLVVRARWGFVRLSQAGNAQHDVTTRLGNPLLSAIGFYEREGFRLELGLGVTLPEAQLPRGGDARLPRSALAFAADLHGLADLWLWSPDRLALIVPFALSRHLGSVVLVSVSGAHAVFLPVAAGERPDLMFLVAGTVQTETAVRVGLRTQLAVLTRDDSTQTTLAPFLETALGPTVLRFELVVPVVGPLEPFGGWLAELGLRVTL